MQKSAYKWFVLMLLPALLLAGCGSSNQGSNSIDPAPEQTNSSPPIHTESPKPDPSNETSATPTPDPQLDMIQEQMKNMSLDEKIGQLVIVGLDGTEMNGFTQKMIQDYKVGGFILFKDNIKNAQQTLALLNDLKQTNTSNDIPLWLSVDQEGGRVSRMSSEFVKIPAAGHVAAANNLPYTNGIGKALGTELKALGFNLDFAPVLDINSNPKNPVIGDRSYGSTPDKVTAHGLEALDGITSEGVAAVVKHFPGHGDTSVDSHYDLPLVHKSLEELEKFELIPFKEAIEQEVDAIMVAHLLMMDLDTKHPASISEAVINDLLREKLGYEGVVITDDMTMGGLLNGNKIGDASVTAVQAGADIVLVSHEEKLRIEALDALRQAVHSGEISKERLDESVYRVLSLKQKYKLSDESTPDIDVSAVNEVINNALQARP
ncbi:beta-N-acetylhexosaminidase [Paenibacillus sp. NPDC057967]|uniref:beta-N-acetylhexosaminidase n=1 Tax=Paenibacillus sp. NPDC057967 TaxID=3346293 RepID=UPI0036D91477